MHQYLKAIGLDSIKERNKIKRILKKIEKEFESQESVLLEDGSKYCELKKEYGDSIGIIVCGERKNSEKFEREYYFPYLAGSGITSYADVIVERRMDKEQYLGVCEDVKIGVSIIFHIQNGAEYARQKSLGNIEKISTSLTLSGLAVSGTVLLPIHKHEFMEKNQKEESRDRMKLLSAARNGDQRAMESLALDDIDIYSQVSQRLNQEDVLSIVDTYFMPCGMECDKYSVMGTILKMRIIQNELTNEPVYIFTLDVNELQFDVCVPVKNVLGEPKRGRRLKADIWLQGKINF